MLQLETREILDYRKITVLLLIAVVGLSMGFAASNSLEKDKAQKDQSYCDEIESQVAEKRNFSGAIACFQPGVVDVNLSEEVEENSELKCVCRHSYKGIVQLIPISISN